jgi:hypothetical protein
MHILTTKTPEEIQTVLASELIGKKLIEYRIGADSAWLNEHHRKRWIHRFKALKRRKNLIVVVYIESQKMFLALPPQDRRALADGARLIV